MVVPSFTQSPPLQSFYFGPFHLQADGQLLKQGQAIPLSPKQQALLWVLVYVGLADCYGCLVSWSALPLEQGKPLMAAALAPEELPCRSFFAPVAAALGDGEATATIRISFPSTLTRRIPKYFAILPLVVNRYS